MSTLPVLQPHLMLGLRTDFTNNAHFITDTEIIYPVGAVLAVHDVIQKRQKYVRLAEKGQNVTHVIISPNKKLLGVVESGPRPTIAIFCTQSCRKKRQISLPAERECLAKNFTAVAFSFDSKFIIAVTGDPDWTLYSFRAEQGKLESTTRANNSNNTGYVRQIACNPNDSNLLALVGEGLIRILACQEFSWRQYGYNKGDQFIFTCATWLSQDRLLIGTKCGRFLVLETGELRAVFQANDLPILSLQFKDELDQGSMTSLKSSNMQYIDDSIEDYAIRFLISFPRGFAFSYMTGTVHMYEMETPLKYIKRNVYKIPDHTITREYEQESKIKLTTVQSIAINPAQDRLMVTCNESQLYSIPLWMQDLNSNPEVMMVEYGFPLHNGPIGDMAICSWKPILLTSGKSDRTLKIFNYEDEEFELIQKFGDDLYGIDLHPTSNYAIVGFSDKLRFLTVTIEEFVVSREFPIRTCKTCSFSKQGYLFAGVNGNIIQVYSSTTFDMMYVLKGHSGEILDMSWSQDDKKMSSCGNDGAVYEWVVSENKRVAETIIKQCAFTGVALTSDGKTTIAVSDDGHIRELLNSNVNRDCIMKYANFDAVVLSNIDQMLMVSGNSGTIYNLRVPLLEKLEYVEYIMHIKKVTKMIITYDDRFLITASEEGTICIWRLLNTEGRAIKLNRDFKVSTDVLISRVILQERLNQIHDQQMRVKEMENEHAYQMRQNDVVHSLRMKDIHSGYCDAIEELKEKNEQLENEHVVEIQNINIDILKMKADHEEAMRELEANYNEKLIFEYEKFLRLEEKMNKMRNDYEKQLSDLKLAKLNSEQEITNQFMEQLEAKQADYDEMVEKHQQQSMASELIKQQLEDDADREIFELKAKHEKQLKEELDLNVKIRGETATANKKALMYQKELDDYIQLVHRLQTEQKKFKTVIADLEKDIFDHKREISERDATIQDKERRIYDLKRKNQELDKFKFILEFKIKELKTQIEPREKKIEEQLIQINEMVRELENLQKVILNMDVLMRQLREKLQSSIEEIQRQIDKNVTLRRALKKIKIDIYQVSRFTQDVPTLIRSVTALYHKFSTDADFDAIQHEEEEANAEFMRQRDFLERTIASLHLRVHKGDKLGSERANLVNENSKLLVETNLLRKNMKVESKYNRKLNSFLGLPRAITPKVAQDKLKRATMTRDDIHVQYQQQIKENGKTIDAMQEENTRLTNDVVAAIKLKMDEDD